MGGVYTPTTVVQTMLEYIGYNGSNILSKHIMENSCGDGAFLKEIVKRYCEAFTSVANTDINQLRQGLETFIHGIEIDYAEYKKCLQNLDQIAASYGVKAVKWDIKNADALTISEYDGKMDFIVGNPPYVRVHNLQNYTQVKKFNFAQDGMTDLYLVFFEIGFRQLNPKGKMCLITPSSFLSSKSGKCLRDYIRKNKNLSLAIDLGRESVFDGISTYTIITLFESGRSVEFINYSYYGSNKNYMLPYEAVFNSNIMSFDDIDTLNLLDDIEKNYACQTERDIVVKNGFATLADSCFIGDFNSSESIFIDVVKASTGKHKKCLFPYRFPGVPMTEVFLSANFKDAYQHLFSNKDKLSKRSIERNMDWFLFGRSQGIKDVFKNKIAISSLVKDLESIKLVEAKAGTGVYGGLYILSDHPFEELRRAIISEDFLRYVKALKKYKSGGYFTFSSLELEKYLSYKLKGEKKHARHQLQLFG